MEATEIIEKRKDASPIHEDLNMLFRKLKKIHGLSFSFLVECRKGKCVLVASALSGAHLQFALASREQPTQYIQ